MKVLADDDEVVCLYCGGGGFPIAAEDWTVNVNDIVRLEAYRMIKLIIITTSSVVLTNTSTYSVALVKAPQSPGSGFHAYLRNEKEMEVNKAGDYLFPWKPKTNATSDFHFLLPSAILDGDKYFNNLELEDVFYVSCQLVFSLHTKLDFLTQDSTLTFAFQKDSRHIYLEKTIRPYSEVYLGEEFPPDEAEGRVGNIRYTLHMAGVFQLSRNEPLGIYVKSNHPVVMAFHPTSSFAIVRTTTNYPGVHGSLQGFPQAIDSGDPYRVTGWKSRGFFGLYDLLGGSHDKNNTFTATLPGVYFATGELTIIHAQLFTSLQRLGRCIGLS